MPAAESGHVQRAGRDPVRRRQAYVPEADQHLRTGPARPGTLCAVRTLHPFLGPDRRGSLHRSHGTRCAPTGRHCAGRAVPVLLLGQHGADLPGRCSHGHRLPVPGQTVRPGLQSQCLRALRFGLCTADRSSARPGVATTRRRRPRGQRGVELRQGPLGFHLRNGR